MLIEFVINLYFTMENDSVGIDDFYEFKCNRIEFIAHKSCTFDGKEFSNNKFINKYHHSLQYLKDKCELIDNIENNTYIDIRRSIKFSPYSVQILFSFVADKIWFETYDELYGYISQKYPHLIKNNDIKIALK